MNKIIIFYMLLFFILKYIYNKFKINSIENETNHINNYIEMNHKPNLWIHLPSDKNSRKWYSFGSRTSNNINIPLSYLCIDSIKKHCSEDFNIIYVTDNSFNEFIPDFNENIHTKPNDIREKLRSICMLKLLYYYGGIIVPYSFICNKSLISLYNSGPFSFELSNKSINNSKNLFLPSIKFMGSEKNNELIFKLIEKYNKIENNITINIGNILKDKITTIDGRLIGVKSVDNKTLYVDDYFNNCKLHPDRYGTLLPIDDFISKSKYSWICRMNKQQLIHSPLNCILEQFSG